MLFSQKYWVYVIIPIDEIIVFRGVAKNHQPEMLGGMEYVASFLNGIPSIVGNSSSTMEHYPFLTFMYPKIITSCESPLITSFKSYKSPLVPTVKFDKTIDVPWLQLYV